jgi:hypothetical protein
VRAGTHRLTDATKHNSDTQKKHEPKASQIRDIDRISLRHPAKDVVSKRQEITVCTTSQSGTYEIISHPRNHIAAMKLHCIDEVTPHPRNPA